MVMTVLLHMWRPQAWIFCKCTVVFVLWLWLPSQYVDGKYDECEQDACSSNGEGYVQRVDGWMAGGRLMLAGCVVVGGRLAVGGLSCVQC